MNKTLKNDLTAIHELLENTFHQSIDFLNNLDSMPTCCQLTQQQQNSLPQLNLPEQGYGGLAALNQFNTQFKEFIVASGGPRYWGYVTGGSTPAAIIGDILATIYDQNTQAISGEGMCLHVSKFRQLIYYWIYSICQGNLPADLSPARPWQIFLRWLWPDNGMTRSLNRILLLMV